MNGFDLRGVTLPQKLLLALVIGFLYLPILVVIVISFNQNTVFLFPYEFTVDHYVELFAGRRYNAALVNSLNIAVGSGLLSMCLGASAAWGVTRYDFRGRYLVMGLFVLPLVVPTLIVAVSGSLIMSELYNLPQGIVPAILMQSIHGMAFSFLIMLTQLSQYPSELDEAAKTYGATSLQRLWEVTLPLIWPGLLGAFLLPFLLAFNNFDLTFYSVGASPTLPTITWGQLRHGIRPSLFALSSLIVVFTVVVVGVIHVAGRSFWNADGGGS